MHFCNKTIHQDSGNQAAKAAAACRLGCSRTAGGYLRIPALGLAALLMILLPAAFAGAVDTSNPEAVPTRLPADTGRPTYHLSVDSAYEAAQKDNCPVLLVFRAEWDVFSRAFTERTLEPELFQRFGPCVHLVSLDVDRNSHLAADYRVSFLPYLVLLSPDGKVLAERKGILTPAELSQWIEDGVERWNRGEWIGISASGELGKFLEKFHSATDSTADQEKLIALLGERHPGDRRLAAEIIMADPRRFMAQLMAAANDSHLATRLGAGELIGRLFPDAPLPDPWASHSRRREDTARLLHWWEAQRLKPGLWQHTVRPERVGQATAVGKRLEPEAVRALIREIQSGDAIRRTRAMTELSSMGMAVVPALQHAIVEAQALGKEEIVLLLEDTRWSIVVTTDIARRLPQARRILARGTSKDRQDLADTLGKLGRPALPVLVEMTREEDALVQESAVRGLAEINSREAVRAMADLLASSNANLRMITAQLLGESEQVEAAAYLRQVLQDPNDVVAATAIAALEELKAATEGPALVACLSDSRWRIRAAAAEAIGKLEIGSAGGDLLKLIDDPDPFVVRAVLQALDELKIHASAEQIRSAAFKHPDLLRGIIAHILKSPSPELAQTIGDVYHKADAAGKEQILIVLAHEEIAKKKFDPFWSKFFSDIMAAGDSRTRSRALQAMTSLWVELAEPYIEDALADPDPQVQQAAVKAVLTSACYHYGAASSSQGPDYDIMRYHNKTPEEIQAEFRKQHDNPPENLKDKIDRADRVVELHRTWHRLIDSRLQEPVPMLELMALGLTGDAGRALAMLPAAITPEFVVKFKKRSYLNFAFEQMIAKLKWPQCRPLIGELMQDSAICILLLAHADMADRRLVTYMLDSPVLIRALAKGSKPLRKLIVRKLISTDETISLLRSTKSIMNTAVAFTAAEDPFVKSMGVWAAGHHSETAAAQLAKFLADPNPWVRRSAVVSLIRKIEFPLERVKLLTPLLEDPSEDVLECVLIGLLPPRLRKDDSLKRQLSEFKYGNYGVYIYESSYGEEAESTRPLSFPDEQPVWLDQVRGRFDRRASLRNDRLPGLMALILARYGDFTAFSSLMAGWDQSAGSRLNAIQILTIGISRNSDYLKALDRYAQSATKPSELEVILETVRHMKGREVRQLRKRINRLLRTM